MSTKTLRKRVALIAVSAVGFGLLSSVAANAASEITATTNTTNISRGVVTALTVTSHAGTATITSSGALSIDVAAGSAATNVTVSGGTFGTFISGVATISGDLTKATSSSATAIVGLYAIPNAGVSQMVIKSYNGATTTSAIDVINVKVVSSGTVGVLDLGESKANAVANGTTIDSLADTDITGVDVLGASVIRNGQVGQIAYNLRDANDAALSSSGTVTATAPSGLVVSLDGSFYASSVAIANTNSYGSVYFKQATTNAPGSGAVTLAYNGTQVWSKTVTVVGDIAKIRLTAGDTIGKTNLAGAITTAGTATDASGAVQTKNAGSFTFAALDSAGNVIGGKTISIDTGRYNASVSGVTLDNSGATTAYSATAELSGAGGTGETLGTWTCTTTAGSANIRLKVTNAALATVYSNELAAGCAGGPDSYTAKLDKTSYVPGDIAVLTITAKTSAGTTPYTASTLGTTGSAEVSIVGSNLTPVVAPTNVDTFGNTGSKTYKFIVGSTEGSYNMVVDLPKYDVAAGGSGVAQTVAYSIKSSSTAVSNADVLAAIVKLIASINKQIAALQKAIMKK